MFLLKILWNKCVGGKCLCKRFKKILLILVLTFIEYRGLNHIILRLRLRLSLACGSDGVSGIKTGFSWNPHFFKASLYVLILLLKVSSFDDNLEILLLMDIGICFLILAFLFLSTSCPEKSPVIDLSLLKMKSSKGVLLGIWQRCFLQR